jgi:hypothetical protein
MCRVDRSTTTWDVDGDEDRMTSRELLPKFSYGNTSRMIFAAGDTIVLDNVSRGPLLARQVAVPLPIL